MEEAAEKVANALKVPEEDRAAFAELFETVREARGREPSFEQLKDWNGRRYFGTSRAEATVRAMLVQRREELSTAVQQLASAAGKDEEGVWRQAEQRFVFMGVYAAGTPLDDLFDNLLQELETAASTPKPQADAFKLVAGVFDKRHAAIRARAYPYRPACCSSDGDEVVECHRVGGGGAKSLLVGFMALNGNYADDLSVDPAFQGRGIAKAIVCAAAARLLSQGSDDLRLDVRACNLPGIGMYKAIGFEVVRRTFPSFYDWHGGYSMKASTQALAKMLETTGFDISSLYE